MKKNGIWHLILVYIYISLFYVVFQELVHLVHDNYKFSTTSNISKQFQTKTIPKTCFGLNKPLIGLLWLISSLFLYFLSVLSFSIFYRRLGCQPSVLTAHVITHKLQSDLKSKGIAECDRTVHLIASPLH